MEKLTDLIGKKIVVCGTPSEVVAINFDMGITAKDKRGFQTLCLNKKDFFSLLTCSQEQKEELYKNLFYEIVNKIEEGKFKHMYLYPNGSWFYIDYNAFDCDKMNCAFE